MFHYSRSVFVISSFPDYGRTGNWVCIYNFFHPYTGTMTYQESRGGERSLFHVYMLRALSVENLKKIIKATCLQ